MRDLERRGEWRLGRHGRWARPLHVRPRRDHTCAASEPTFGSRT